MQAIGDIISYFFSYYFSCHAKKCTKIQLGENIWYFFSQCLYFFPLRPCNNCSTLTDCVLGGKYCKREIKSYFSRWTLSFFVTVSELSISTGENIWYFFPLCLYFCPCVFIFSPCVFIFSLLGHAINCSTFAGGVLGENILCLCFSPWSCFMVFILPFFLDSFLEMSLRRNNIIFSPLVHFFPTCDRKTNNLMVYNAYKAVIYTNFLKKYK